MKAIDLQDAEFRYDGNDLQICLRKDDLPEQIPDSSVILEIDGIINLYTTQSLSQIVDNLIKRDIKNLFFNLSKVKYIDSSGLGAIMGFHVRLNKLGGYLKIFSPSSTVDKVMKMIKLKSILAVYETVEEAILSI